MVAIAAKSKAAIVLSEEEKLHLTNIARLDDNKWAKDRAKILLCLGEMGVTDAARTCDTALTQAARMKKRWLESELTGSVRVNSICHTGNGRKKNDTTLRNRIDNIIQFNKALNQNISRNARSAAIVEMAREEGIKISVRTVTRFLEMHEKQTINA